MAILLASSIGSCRAISLSGGGTSIGDSEEDRDWKLLLRKYMPDYNEAREFWLDYYYLSRLPGSERVKGLLGEGEADMERGASS